jgi:predicted hotdog family 3-hydroxylacyl-ACP dehydratase
LSRTQVDLPAEQLVPHRGPMLLLERIIDAGADGASASATVRIGDLFYRPEGTGAWTGIEYMAQTIAAWAGWHARQRNQAPKVGFLLGTRRYLCHRSFFKEGETLHIDVEREIDAGNGLGRFDCSIRIDGLEIARGQLAVFEPLDAKAFLMDQKIER